MYLNRKSPRRFLLRATGFLAFACALHPTQLLAQEYCSSSFSTNTYGYTDGNNGLNVVLIGGAPGPSAAQVRANIEARSSWMWCLDGATHCTLEPLPIECDVNGEVRWHFTFTRSDGVFIDQIAGATCGYTASCPAGFAVSAGNNCTLVQPEVQSCSTKPRPSKTRGKPVFGSCQEGNPCDVATGNKYEVEPDYPAPAAGGLSYTRYFNSDQYAPTGRLGTGWRDEFDRQLLFSELSPVAQVASNLNRTALVYRPDGKIITFTMSGSIAAASDPDTVETLVQSDPNTWLFTTADDTVEAYKYVYLGGTRVPQLQSIRFRTGLTLTMTWSSYYLTTVTDNFGHTLTFTYDGNLHVLTMTDAAGNEFFYNYNTAGYLSDVYYPGPTPGSNIGAPHRQYVYGDAANPGALTSIVDENGDTFATWAYDSQRRSVSSSHASGQDLYTFTYNADGTTTVTEGGGGSRVYSFAMVNQVPKYTNIVQGSLSNSATYDTRGYPLTRTDRNATQTSFQYDARGLQLFRTEGLTSAGASTPRTRTIATTWHSSFHLPLVESIYAGATATGTPLKTTTFTYDGSGNILTKTVSDPASSTSRTWTYTYNAVGQVLTIDGPRTDVADTTTYTYYSCTTGIQCGQVNTVTDAAGNFTTYNTYNAVGQPLTVTDANGVVATLTYDARQRLKTRQVGTETTTYDYYPTGLLQKVTQPDSSFVQYTYDAAHRLTGIADGLGNHVTYTLDVMGNRTAESVYDPSNVLSRALSNVYNNLNQLAQRIGSAGTAAVTTTLGYDNNGNQTTINAPMGRNSTNAYDEMNRLKQITDPANGISQFTYDANDNITSVKDPANLITNYVYNGIGDLKQLVSPSTGTSNNTYDSGGNLKTTSDARGLGGTYTFDVLNRVTQIAYGDQTLLYGYDAGTNGKGRMTSASDGAHSMAWLYDGFGRVISKSQTIGGVVEAVSNGYTNGRLTSMTTPSGQSVTYSYTNGQVTGITVNGTTLLSGVLYEPFGPVRGWTWGNGTNETRLHDTDGNPSTIAGAESTTYNLDNAFRIQGISNANTPAASWTYGYDSLDRLTSGTSTTSAISWTFDADGNRQTQLGAAAPGYSASLLSFTYNNRGRMASVTTSGTTNYTYNALGQRIRKSGPGGTTVFAYDESGRLLGEYTSAGALIEETIWLGDLPVATLRPGTPVAIYYVHADHLGTPRAVTRTSDNAKVWRWDSDPFGVAVPNQNPSGLGMFVYNLRMPGQYADSETGLSYNYYRDYDPQAGRYVGSDPIGLNGGGWSTYGYVSNNPLSFFDPFGLNQCDIDVARATAANADLHLDTGQSFTFPDSYGVGYIRSDTPGRITRAVTNAYGTRLSDYYLQNLTNAQAAELLNTIIHEGVHRTLPLDDPRQPDNAGTGYAYAEAKRLTTPALVKQYQQERRTCGCTK